MFRVLSPVFGLPPLGHGGMANVSRLAFPQHIYKETCEFFRLQRNG
jgi:hypothetical protein